MDINSYKGSKPFIFTSILVVHHNPEGCGHGGQKINTLRHSHQQVGQNLGTVTILQITTRNMKILKKYSYA